MAKRRNSLVMTEADWRARDDARTLIEAEKINNDPKRLAAAKKKLKEIIAESKQALADAVAVSE